MERLSLQSSMDIIRLNNTLGKEYSFLADYIKEYCI